jgi:23S rRNA (pseudouridine1915-N3)-methyltransferase
LKTYLVAVGAKMPDWVQAGVAEYRKRLSGTVSFDIIEVLAKKRTRNSDLQRIKEQEGDSLLAAIPKNALPIALDLSGKAVDTMALAKLLGGWVDESQDVAFMIGGPEGLSSNCLEKSRLKISLSNLTFAHPLVRLIMAEQIYRAYSINQGMPYHR